MSDLICRSELIEEINELLKSPYANQQQFGAERRDAIEIVRDLCVKRQPTAYDIGKVVEELEERSKEYNSGVRLHGKPEEMLTDDAIEIVKQGGVSDDVCEWKGKEKEYIQNPHTKRLYSNEPSMKNVYCNTCGKKIKVVE